MDTWTEQAFIPIFFPEFQGVLRGGCWWGGLPQLCPHPGSYSGQEIQLSARRCVKTIWYDIAAGNDTYLDQTKALNTSPD